MSTYTKLVKTDAGTLQVEMIQCDFCGNEQQANGVVGWLHTSAVDVNVGKVGNLPAVGHFDKAECVAAYFSWKPRDPIPVGYQKQAERLFNSSPLHEVLHNGRRLYAGNDGERVLKVLEGEL
jgi:hypothetical protein